MKLEQHVEKIKNRILAAFEKQLILDGILPTGKGEVKDENLKLLLENLVKETGSYANGRIKLLDEYTFTLFNRIAAIKVLEARQLIPEVISRRTIHGDRSFAHKLWLESNEDKKGNEFEGLYDFITHWFKELSKEINLYSEGYLFHRIPEAVDLKEIIDLFNELAEEEWHSDDIMGWLYESYNKTELKLFKESEAKIEYDKVSLTSQVYTPKWVVKFLVDNSLGKLYLEMHPDSQLKEKYKIANAPKTRIREIKEVKEIKLIDPAPGSGNFLLYGFDLIYDMYLEEDKYDEDEIPKLIIENNLYGIDIDDRAIQIAQLGLYIKAKEKNKNVKIEKYNVVSSDFYLPEYEDVKELFEENDKLDPRAIKIVHDTWKDLRNAHKFGSLIQIESKILIQLSAIKEKTKDTLFTEKDEDIFSSFEKDVFPRLKESVSKYSNGKKNGFIKSKTIDSLTFLEILSQKYDVAVANPPYTDSGNYGEELKEFIKDNYKKPFDFYANLYSCFIKKCSDLIIETGKVAMIHPMTFMYIKSFEDVRDYILEKLHINIFVEYGLSNLFGSVMVDPAFYVLEKKIKSSEESLFISLDQYTRTPQEKYKQEYCLKALIDYTYGETNSHNYTCEQSKLKLIKSYPFIYWISDEFREKFKEKDLKDYLDIRQGIATGNNNRFLRYWWEVNINDISIDHRLDGKKWVGYVKGGPYRKWYGNLWLVISFDTHSYNILSISGNTLPSKNYYFLEGITCSGRSSSKGMSYRRYPKNQLFDVGASGIFPKGNIELNYALGFLNSKIVNYIINCLNPTVNTSEGDVKRIPFVIPSKENNEKVSFNVQKNVLIKKHINEFTIVERDYINNPINWSKGYSKNLDVKTLVKYYLDYENLLLAEVLFNEAIINKTIFEVYSLSEKDKEMVLTKEGVPVGELPVLEEARDAYLEQIELFHKQNDEVLKDVGSTYEYVKNLPTKKISEERKQELLVLFESLYQNNNDLEEFCIKQNENPINIWFLFKNSNVLPLQRTQTIAMELLVDFIRELLIEDEDGIIPLVSIPGEKLLSELVEQKFFQKGFTTAQYSNFSGLLGRDINIYLDNNFFKDFSDHLNLFMYLPKTPFIWHLSSGVYGAFECYIIIYKWSKDAMFRLRSVYVDKRESALRNRLLDIGNDTTAKGLNEMDLIRKQLIELDNFKKKLDEILASGYNPKLDDGVGKNIAPLQEKGILKYEVLNSSQLKKYLRADW